MNGFKFIARDFNMVCLGNNRIKKFKKIKKDTENLGSTVNHYFMVYILRVILNISSTGIEPRMYEKTVYTEKF